MAQNDIEGILGLQDIRRGTKAGSDTLSLGTPANYADINHLKARLTAANGAYFTAARLNQMTKNDMVFALRAIDDAASIK